MMRKILLIGLAGFAAAPAQAGELFGGLYKHAVDTPLSLGGGLEHGVDLQLGLRGRPVLWKLQPYAFGALNSNGDTDYAAAGLSARFGRRIFVRPGLGLAIHNGSAGRYYRSDRIAFGSRILFEPELGIGTDLGDRVSLEASWVHLSHAQLFSRENPGIDNIGARLTFRL
ncbi:acyloxyacyl hydrolase [Sphingomonas ginkgonis]|uniref:Acyloxyacyl hydrolase n=1 Tax=Sphingomonas ginkgonis TaxID=2315330 RepID=A0A3R9Y4J6_9SPHN|nr:acyloxyacyl hydrolase [Sphingomonas ginkgonis]RST30023.1 acyloxyacyl hydrolase [Sphingomonas ginkgonis]